uniref:Uncharacterized protein n=1 Tax=Ammonifex degensii TaxID=42838 RepID=A0A7C2I221_9THEO
MPYRFQEIQNHLNRLRQDLNNIGQTAMQLQQIEQQAQSQLARISQQENQNSQQLQRIYQLSMSLQNEINAISAATQQMAAAPAYAYSPGAWGAGAGQWTATGTFAAPYTGATGAFTTPYAGAAGSFAAPYSSFAAGGQALANVPAFSANVSAPATSAGSVYGGTQAYRPWPDNT